MPPFEGRTRLGSLVQAARRKQIEQIGYARGTLLGVGLFFLFWGLIELASLETQIDQLMRQQNAGQQFDGAAREMIRKVGVIVSLGIVALGVLHLIFALVVHLSPLPITVIALVLFLGVIVILGVAAPGTLLPQSVFLFLVQVIRIALIVALVRSVQKAIAHDRARRAEEEEEEEDEAENEVADDDERPGRLRR